MLNTLKSISYIKPVFKKRPIDIYIDKDSIKDHN